VSIRRRLPAPGLQGDYRGTCMVCLRPTDTGLAFQGEAEWIIAGYHVLGIPEDQAHQMLAQMNPEGWGNGLVPCGIVTVAARVCTDCAAQATDNGGFPVALALPGQPLPTIGQFPTIGKGGDDDR
jgi:hypothetical protein